MTRPLFAAVLLFAGLVACTKSPTEAGTALGRDHVEAIRDDSLTYERFAEDLEDGFAAYETEAERDQFSDAYFDAIEPEQTRIAALYMQYLGHHAGEAIGDAMESVGRGFGRMAGGFFDGLKQVGGDRAEAEKDRSLRDLGRSIGRTMKKVGNDLAEVAEGIEEGLDE
ncbi:MAG: hypothetical protein RIT81_00945 [Deltaproteobacteria bacterium]